MQRLKFGAAALVALVMVAVSPGSAQFVTFSGFDLGAGVPGVNAIAARNAFLAATGGSVGIDFESATLPGGVGLSGGSRVSSSCGGALCGDNTTPAGSWMYQLAGGSATFTFGSPVNYFGAFFGGLQLATNTITFSDGSSRTITLPGSGLDGGGGVAFVGFTDFGNFTSSITISAAPDPACGGCGDIIAADDVIFGTDGAGVVPEPASMTLLATGLVGVVGAGMRRRKKA